MDAEATVEEHQEAPVPLVTYVNNILHSIFSMLKCTSTISKSTTLMDCIGANLTVPTTSIEPSFITRAFCTARGNTTKNYLMKINEAPSRELFFTKKMKMLSRLDGFMLSGILGANFFSTSQLLYPNMKFRLQLIRARAKFCMISDNPNVSLGIVDCSPYTRCFALKDDYHRK